MAGASVLTQLLVRATRDLRYEPAFFRALLNATVYAHVPLGDPISRRLRFIQFHHPETGQLLLPFFTDKRKARAATGSDARVVTLRGRVFLEATRGATLMLNPNDERGTLYPEEIDVLLRTGYMARFESTKVQLGEEPLVGPTGFTPAWLLDLLTVSLAALSYVKVGYLASLHAVPGAGAPSLLLALGVDAGRGDRAVHAVITALQPACRQHQFALDIIHFIEPVERPAWVEAFGLRPVYEKSWGERLISNGQPISIRKS